VVSFASEVARKAFEQQGLTQIKKVLGDSATLKSRDYSVVIPRLPLALGQGLDVTQKLYAQNPLRGKVEITRACFTAKANKTTKSYAPFVIGVREPGQANHLCERGVVLDGELFDCELFYNGAKLKRCFNC